MKKLLLILLLLPVICFADEQSEQQCQLDSLRKDIAIIELRSQVNMLLETEYRDTLIKIKQLNEIMQEQSQSEKIE